VRELGDEIRSAGDDVDPQRIAELAAIGTREAVEELVALFDVLLSPYMRREVLKGIAAYDGIEGCGQYALQALSDAATAASDRDVRLFAVDRIAACSRHGHAFLRSIVDSAAEDEVRLAAMARHVEAPAPEDAAWYRALYEPRTEKDVKSKGRGKRDELPWAGSQAGGDGRVPYVLEGIREHAFGALSSELSTEEVIHAATDRARGIRRAALDELASRDDVEARRAALEIAEERYKRGGDPTARLEAVQVLARIRGPEIVGELADDMTRADLPRELALGIADLVDASADPDVDRLLSKRLGKGRPQEVLVTLRATAHVRDDKLDKTRRKLLGEKEADVVREVLDILADHGDAGALEDIEELAQRSKDPLVTASAFSAMGRIYGEDDAWTARLVQLAAAESVPTRNSALSQLGDRSGPEVHAALVAGLQSDSWSTRLVAAHALEKQRTPEAVGALVERIVREEGRPAREMGRILFQLTGQPYRDRGASWKAWWDREGAEFVLPDPAEIARLEREEKEREEREVTRADFFGVKIESTRVLFVLDVSGSMDFQMRGRFVGEPGEPRIDYARRELGRCLDGLDPNAFFNLVFFSDRSEAWREHGVPADPEAITAAKKTLDRIRPGGGTDLYGALKIALADPDADTIYVLSDGEPKNGEVIDPFVIRERVLAWNENRGIVIHAIAFGAQIDILRWLAEDSGGTYLSFQ